MNVFNKTLCCVKRKYFDVANKKKRLIAPMLHWIKPEGFAM